MALFGDCDVHPIAFSFSFYSIFLTITENIHLLCFKGTIKVGDVLSNDR